MESIKTSLIKIMIRISSSDDEFIKHMKGTFSIKELCDILNINRNRYNYLKRIKQLDHEILKIKE